MVLSGCQSRWENPPIYPGAENVQEGGFDVADSGTSDVRVTTAETGDSPEAVYAYYEQALAEAGWYAEYRGGSGLCRATLSFGDRLWDEGFVRYSIGVEAVEAGGRTDVTLTVCRVRRW